MSIDFMKDEPQRFRDWAGKELVATFVGECICGTRLYDDGDENDPRGALGRHAAQALAPDAEPDLTRTHYICWDCYDDRRLREIAVTNAVFVELEDGNGN